MGSVKIKGTNGAEADLGNFDLFDLGDASFIEGLSKGMAGEETHSAVGEVIGTPIAETSALINYALGNKEAANRLHKSAMSPLTTDMSGTKQSTNASFIGALIPAGAVDMAIGATAKAVEKIAEKKLVSEMMRFAEKELKLPKAEAKTTASNLASANNLEKSISGKQIEKSILAIPKDLAGAAASTLAMPNMYQGEKGEFNPNTEEIVKATFEAGLPFIAVVHGAGAATKMAVRGAKRIKLDKMIDKNDMAKVNIPIDALEAMTGGLRKTLDRPPKEGETGFYFDPKTRAVYARSDTLGSIVGTFVKVDGKDTLVIDMRQSNINPKIKTRKIGGKPVIEPVNDHIAAKIKEYVKAVKEKKDLSGSKASFIDEGGPSKVVEDINEIETALSEIAKSSSSQIENMKLGEFMKNHTDEISNKIDPNNAEFREAIKTVGVDGTIKDLIDYLNERKTNPTKESVADFVSSFNDEAGTNGAASGVSYKGDSYEVANKEAFKRIKYLSDKKDEGLISEIFKAEKYRDLTPEERKAVISKLSEYIDEDSVYAKDVYGKSFSKTEAKKLANKDKRAFAIETEDGWHVYRAELKNDLKNNEKAIKNEDDIFYENVAKQRRKVSEAKAMKNEAEKNAIEAVGSPAVYRAWKKKNLSSIIYDIERREAKSKKRTTEAQRKKEIIEAIDGIGKQSKKERTAGFRPEEVENTENSNLSKKDIDSLKEFIKNSDWKTIKNAQKKIGDVYREGTLSGSIPREFSGKIRQWLDYSSDQITGKSESYGFIDKTGKLDETKLERMVQSEISSSIKKLKSLQKGTKDKLKKAYYENQLKWFYEQAKDKKFAKDVVDRAKQIAEKKSLIEKARKERDGAEQFEQSKIDAHIKKLENEINELKYPEKGIGEPSETYKEFLEAKTASNEPPIGSKDIGSIRTAHEMTKEDIVRTKLYIGDQKNVKETVTVEVIEKEFKDPKQTGASTSTGKIYIGTKPSDGIRHLENISHELVHQIENYKNYFWKNKKVDIDMLFDELSSIPEIKGLVEYARTKAMQNADRFVEEEFRAYLLGRIFADELLQKNKVLREIYGESRILKDTIESAKKSEIEKINKSIKWTESRMKGALDREDMKMYDRYRQKLDILKQKLDDIENSKHLKYDSLKERLHSDEAKFAFDQYERSFFKLVNGSADVKSAIFGFKTDGMKAYIADKKFHIKWEDLDNRLNELSNSIDELSFFEIFKIDKQSEAMQKAATLKKGFEDAYVESVSNELNAFEGRIKKDFDADYREANYHIGILFSKGFHKIHKEVIENLKNSKWYIDTDRSLGSALAKKLGITDPESILKFNDEVNRMLDAIASDRYYTWFENGKKQQRFYNSLRAERRIMKLASKFGAKDIEALAGTNLVDILSQEIARRRWNQWIRESTSKKYLKNTFSFVQNNYDKIIPYAEKWTQLERIMIEKNLYHNEFGFNPDSVLARYDHVIKIGTVMPKDGKLVKTIVSGKGKYRRTLYMYLEDMPSNVIGNQAGVIVEFEPKQFEKGIYNAKLPGKVYYDKKFGYYQKIGKRRLYLPQSDGLVYRYNKRTKSYDAWYKLNTQEIETVKIFGEGAFDTRITKQFQRNQYLIHKTMLARRSRLNQFKILQEHGVLLSDYEYRLLDIENRDKYIKLDTPDFGSVWFQKRFKHHLYGTEGKSLNDLVNGLPRDYANFIKRKVFRPILGLAEALRGVILTYNLASYINSSLSSYLLYAVHANGGRFMSDLADAKKRLSEMKSLIREIGEEELKAIETGDFTKLNRLKEELASNDMYYALNNGISATIRTNAMAMNAYKENPFMSAVRPLFKDKDAYEMVKNWWALPDSKYGSKFGELFDITEVYPKMALYVNGLKSGMSREEAIQKVIMSFPNYSMNLHPFLATIDILSPYTKYATQYPKMMYAALYNAPVKTGSIIAAGMTTTALSYNVNEGTNDEWFREHGFIKIMDGVYYFKDSATPFNPPYDSEYLNTSVWKNPDRLIWPFDLNPLTITD